MAAPCQQHKLNTMDSKATQRFFLRLIITTSLSKREICMFVPFPASDKVTSKDSEFRKTLRTCSASENAEKNDNSKIIIKEALSTLIWRARPTNNCAVSF